MRNVGVLVLLVGVGTVLAAGCGSLPDDAVPADTTLTAGDHQFAVIHEDVVRHYLVHLPQDLVGEPAAVVMSLHGGGGSAAQHRGQIGLDPVADREGFVVVYPEGVGRALHTWNAGPYCCGLAARTEADDVGFLAAVLGDLAVRLVFDPSRVVVAGHSNGAMMASRFAAERPDLVAGVVAVSAVASPDQVPARPVPMLQIHSVDDPRALYAGGEGPPFPGTDSTVVHFAAPATLAAWAAANGCDATPSESEPVVADNGHTATRIEWNGCSEPVVHLRLTGAGHGWPGAVVRTASVTGPETDVVDASEELWSFAASVL